MPASRTPKVKAAQPRSTSPAPVAMKPREPDHDISIVAIGASAGGLDACRAFLNAMSAKTGMAFIFVQHLAPDHRSLIPGLLAGNTSMTVIEATHGMLIEPDHVYVIPPAAYLTVTGATLHLTRAPAPHGARLPFDVLLQSLAKELGPLAVCVVLSGTGADGSTGLAAIKGSGGLVIVQNPDDAEYDGMPRSAVMTGLADHVLALQEMPKAIAAFVSKLAVSAPSGKSARISRSAATLLDIIVLLRTNTAHDFTSYKQGTLQRRVERRMGLRAIRIDDKEKYLDVLRADSDECENLVKDLLINVTSFFRDKNIFETLASKIIPDLVKAHSSDQPIRIWIAGCSTGEEAYSIAILVREAMIAAKSHLKIQLFASDVDEDAVTVAPRGLLCESDRGRRLRREAFEIFYKRGTRLPYPSRDTCECGVYRAGCTG